MVNVKTTVPTSSRTAGKQQAIVHLFRMSDGPQRLDNRTTGEVFFVVD